MREDVFSSTGFRIREPNTSDYGLVRWSKNAVASLFFTFFPADCRICDSPLIEVSRLPVCKTCLSSIQPLQGCYCTVCGETLLSGIFEDQTESLCGLCQRAHPAFEKAIAYGGYEAGLRDLIHLLKYQQVRPAANVLGAMLAEAILKFESTVPPGRMAVIPVPLHRRKRAQRGFNQSEMIVTNALKSLGRPERFELVAGVLVRRRETESQIGRTRHQRRDNLRGAFAVANAAMIDGRDVLLVDDVFTTGTTVSECARVLRKAGAARVWVATVARTLKVSVLPPRTEILDQRDAEDLAITASV